MEPTGMPNEHELAPLGDKPEVPPSDVPPAAGPPAAGLPAADPPAVAPPAEPTENETSEEETFLNGWFGGEAPAASATVTETELVESVPPGKFAFLKKKFMGLAVWQILVLLVLLLVAVGALKFALKK